MTPQLALSTLLEKRDLSQEEMQSVMQQIMHGEMTPAQIAGILIALRAKGETIIEIAAAARVMRDLSAKVEVADSQFLVDTCGTGGDGMCTFNISTTSALVAAAAGAKVAKHGGRSVSSTCGSADVLESLGVKVSLTPEQVARSINQVGVGFMFAPNHHSAMKHAAPVRKELGVRTLFNLLGPMTNPAAAPNQVLGVFEKGLTAKFAQVLDKLGSRHVMVVHGHGGMDEISLSGPTTVAELQNGMITEYSIEPQQFGFPVSEIEQIKVNNPQEAKTMLLSVLENRPSAARDIVNLNAGAAIYVAGIAPSFKEGIGLAQAVIESGAARKKLAELVEFSSRAAEQAA